MMVRTLFILAASMTLLSTSPPGAAEKTIRVGAYDIPPFTSSSRSSAASEANAHGLFTELLVHVATKEGWRIEWVPCSLNDGFTQLARGEFDILAPAPFLRDQPDLFDFTRGTVLSTWAQLFVKPEASIQSWFDLNSRFVGVLADDHYNRELRNMVKQFDISCRFVEFKTDEDLFQAFDRGWVDAVAADRLHGRFIGSHHNHQETPIIFAPIELRYAVSKGRNSEVLAAIDYHLQIMKMDPDSLYHQLMSEVLGSPPQAVLPGWFKWVLLAAIAFTVLFGVASTVLRFQVNRKTAELALNNQELRNEIELRRHAEAAVRESEGRFRTLFQFAPEPILLVDQYGAISDCNLAAEEILEYTKTELLQLSATELVEGNTFEQIWRNPGGAGRGRVGHGSECLARRGSGETFPAHVAVKILAFDEQASCLMVLRDLSETKQFEQELLKVQKLESVGLLAGGIAHDFNNILTAILGSISLARLHAGANEEVARFLPVAERAALRAKDLTFQLLTFSKGGVPIKARASAFNIVEESCTFALRGSNVNCEILRHEDPWPLKVDVGQISQVMNNIILNAKQAMPDGGTVRVTLSNRQLEAAQQLPLPPGRYVHISITDHGSGIAQSDLSRIFDPYFTTKQDGHGLGLAISYSIVKKHGGLLTAESTPGKGTTFHIHLPAVDSALEAHRNPADGPLALPGKGRILVMDDDKNIRDLIQSMLTDLHYQVTLARDGKEAIELYHAAMKSGARFDAVLMDLTIPGGMGGRQTIEHLLKLDPEVRAVVSSGYSNDPVMSRYGEYGFSAAIAKPYRVEDLSDILRSLS